MAGGAPPARPVFFFFLRTDITGRGTSRARRAESRKPPPTPQLEEKQETRNEAEPNRTGQEETGPRGHLEATRTPTTPRNAPPRESPQGPNKQPATEETKEKNNHYARRGRSTPTGNQPTPQRENTQNQPKPAQNKHDQEGKGTPAATHQNTPGRRTPATTKHSPIPTTPQHW